MAGSNDVDELASGPRAQLGPWLVGVVAAGVAAAGAVVVIHGSDAPRVHAGASAPSTPSARVAGGSVFLEQLARCTRTDLRRRLTVAVEVTNLGARPLRVLGVTPLGASPVLRLSGVRIGHGPCAVVADASAVHLPPAGAVVIALSFRIESGCPRDVGLGASVAFDDGGRLVHADSAQLADLTGMRFAGCLRVGAFGESRTRQRRRYD